MQTLPPGLGLGVAPTHARQVILSVPLACGVGHNSPLERAAGLRCRPLAPIRARATDRRKETEASRYFADVLELKNHLERATDVVLLEHNHLGIWAEDLLPVSLAHAVGAVPRIA